MYHWAREPRMTLTTLYCHYFSTGLSVLLNLKHVKEKIPFPKEISPGCSWAGTPILWPPDAKIWLIWKDPDAGKDWGQEEKGTTEGEMAGWHHRLNGHGFWWIPGVGDGQGGLACCGSWGRKELDTTEWLNWTEEKVQTSKFHNLLDVKKLCNHAVTNYATALSNPSPNYHST